MTLTEYTICKPKSYAEFCQYLNNKHGAVEGNYLTGKPLHTGTIRGLFIHHVAETIFPGLSSEKRVEEADEKYPENNWQEPENLVYCDYLEHALLHIKIAEETKILSIKELIVEGLSNHLIPELQDFFMSGNEYKYPKIYYDVVRSNKDTFEALVKDYKALIDLRFIVFETNLVLYEQMRTGLNTANKALIILGTGLGKSTTALQYLYETKARALVLTPKNSINKDWIQRKKEGYSIIDVLTYSAFAARYKKNKINFTDYDIVICDEVHHIGADGWGEGIRDILVGKINIKVLGITATDARTDKIKIEDYFSTENTYYGNAIEDAIESGLVYPFSYITSIYDTAGLKTEVDKLRAKIDPADNTSKRLVGKLDTELSKFNLINTLTKYNMPAVPKGFVFVSKDITNISKIKSILEQAYPNAIFRKLHSKLSKDEQRKNIEWFNSSADADKPKYLISIDMVSEGVHYSGINTLIMFRKTTSYLVYAQQIGRIITLVKNNKDPHAIVFDLVNNIDNVVYGTLIKNGAARTIPGVLKNLKSTQIQVSDETRDFVDSIKELKQRTADDWEAQEFNIVKEEYIKSKDVYSCLKKINVFHGYDKRTYHSVLGKLCREGILDDRNRKVICIETQKIYNTVSEACIDAGSGISDALSFRAKTANGYHWCYLDDKEAQQRYSTFIGKLKKIYAKDRGILCIETGVIYKNQKDAITNGGATNTLNSCLSKKVLTSGKYHWSFADDIERIQELAQFKNHNITGSQIVCFETGKVYKNNTEAKLDTGASTIGLALDQAQKTSGGYHWCHKTLYDQGWQPIAKNPINATEVVCVETGTIFKSQTEAENITGAKAISNCCKNWGNTSGGYHWCYLKDLEKFKLLKKKKSWNVHAIINVETEEYFEAVSCVLEKYPKISRSTLFRALKDSTKLAGGYHWKYVEEEKNKE